MSHEVAETDQNLMPEHASPPAPNPQAWLWAEIARRFGDDAAADLHNAYLVESRAYHQRRHHPTPGQPPAAPPRQTKRGAR